jgi:hypothetical protein
MQFIFEVKELWTVACKKWDKEATVMIQNVIDRAQMEQLINCTTAAEMADTKRDT